MISDFGETYLHFSDLQIINSTDENVQTLFRAQLK